MTIPDFLTQDADGFIHLTGHRIGLHHVIRPYRDGHSPEMLLEHYPTLSLPLIHKVIAFYLENRAILDPAFDAQDAEIEQQRQTSQTSSAAPDRAELRRRFEATRRAEAL